MDIKNYLRLMATLYGQSETGANTTQGGLLVAEEWIVNSDEKLQNAINELTDLYNREKYLIVEYTSGKQRTKLQNRALHVFCELLAQALNAAGLDMKLVLSRLSKNATIPWSKYTVKERLWKPIQVAKINKESTTEAERGDYKEIHDTLIKILCETFETDQLNIDWPVDKDKKS